MADDPEDDKTLLSQLSNTQFSTSENSLARCRASHVSENPGEKVDKYSSHIDNGCLQGCMIRETISSGSSHDKPNSESVLNDSPTRTSVQKSSPVKVYMKRKRLENENGFAKKAKSSCFAGANGGISNSNCVELNDLSGGVNGGKDYGDGNWTGDSEDDNGGTHFEIKVVKNISTNAQGDDPRLSCDLAYVKSWPSKKTGGTSGVKDQEVDDDLLLNEFSSLKGRRKSAGKGIGISFKISTVKENNSENSSRDDELEEDDSIPLSKMCLPHKREEHSMNEKSFLYRKANVKKEESLKNLTEQHELKENLLLPGSLKSPKLSGSVSKINMGISMKRHKDITEENSNLLSKEEESDDDLLLCQISRSKKQKAPLKTQISSEREIAKEEEARKTSRGTLSSREKVSECIDSQNSGMVLRDVTKESIFNSNNIPLGVPKEEDHTEVTPNVLGNHDSVRTTLICKSRAKQLRALSKSLQALDSEDEENHTEEAGNSYEDEAGEEEEEKDEEDSESEGDDDDDEDEDYSTQSRKRSTVRVKSKVRMSLTSMRVNAPSRSKIQTSNSLPKAGKRVVVKEEADDKEDFKEDSEEQEDDDDEEWEDDDDDDEYSGSKGNHKRKRTLTRAKSTKEKQVRKKVKKMKDVPGAGGGQKWTTLEHNGVIFPPFYQPHGVKMLYEGKPMDLTPEQEEVATMFAVMKETEYMSKPKFLSNFWNDWRKLLGSNHVIQKLEECDFTPIYEWHLAEKEKKKQLSSEEKKAIKEEKIKQEEKYMWAMVDGVKEKVGNFRVEPPGLFRGRGEHPKMGKLKRRIYPEDIVINIGADSPVPECPLPGHRWKEVRNDDTVTWLAYWNDPINPKEQKYVFLAASSTIKGQSDKEKYEKARVLKDYIEDIRKTYTENFTSSDPTARQIAVATYLIDRLALRAGNEKDDDEADTVGCCSLKVEHVSLIPPSSLEFDFLGKDSIRYFNVVEVVAPVYAAIGDLRKGKAPGSDLFDKLDTNKLNMHLKNIMPQLTAKVFRTYNASITLDNLLRQTDGKLLAERVAAYQRANKEVAILCNHQRTVSKSHGAQMERLETKLNELNDLVDELEKDLERAKQGKPPLKDADGNPKKNQNPDVLAKKISQVKQKMEKMKLDMTIKEDLKTVALGTSKINYMDPRISVAWCKSHEVPIEKIFNKSLLAKFAWAMDVEMTFRF
ncbi:hypothetical protein KP509_22G051300 [Ceratopteris richardii]|uniref:DNA topoisomerase I n=1 Tax=Ceratopteris richardii TaxID=49495 RepID=A0A8T2S8B8_CERRI|nr:hypothetical protein KP509_22G051300 [Ceratopteris richardii]KAH7307244.1 hypothetical protein KP509_22G051300 [Ceratopteris richardii]